MSGLDVLQARIANARRLLEEVRANQPTSPQAAAAQGGSGFLEWLDVVQHLAPDLMNTVDRAGQPRACCPKCGAPNRQVRACVRDFTHEPHLVMLTSQHCDGTPIPEETP